MQKQLLMILFLIFLIGSRFDRQLLVSTSSVMTQEGQRVPLRSHVPQDATATSLGNQNFVSYRNYTPLALRRHAELFSQIPPWSAQTI